MAGQLFWGVSGCCLLRDAFRCLFYRYAYCVSIFTVLRSANVGAAFCFFGHFFTSPLFARTNDRSRKARGLFNATSDLVGAFFSHAKHCSPRPFAVLRSLISFRPAGRARNDQVSGNRYVPIHRSIGDYRFVPGRVYDPILQCSRNCGAVRPRNDEGRGVYRRLMIVLILTCLQDGLCGNLRGAFYPTIRGTTLAKDDRVLLCCIRGYVNGATNCLVEERDGHRLEVGSEGGQVINVREVFLLYFIAKSCDPIVRF